jgi:hypothetical protein
VKAIKLTIAIMVSLACLPTHAAVITDTVWADGKEWAQPDLFVGERVSWNDLAAVCPSGICGGTLTTWTGTTFVLDGGIFAGVEDVNGLFNSYLRAGGVTGDDLLSGPDEYEEDFSTWGPAFFEDFRAINEFGEIVRGITYTTSLASPDESYFGYIAYSPSSPNMVARVNTNRDFSKADNSVVEGVWLYRPPSTAPTAVPTMSTYGLIFTVIGLLIVAVRRLSSKSVKRD